MSKTVKGGSLLKSSIMIVGEKNNFPGFSAQETQKLHHFLHLTGGNWRSAIYVECRHGGHLMVADRDARPFLISADLFHDMTGIRPERDEMIGGLREQSFGEVFRQWLVWNTDSDRECGICKLHDRMGGDEP